MRDYFKELIVKNKGVPHKIENMLNNLPKNVKGKAFEEFISVLYEGNGFSSSVVGGKSDGGADVLVFNKEGDLYPIQIIQVKNHLSPISYDDVRTELRKFDEVSSKKYNCRNYSIVSMSGFVSLSASDDNVFGLRRFNISLVDFSGLKYLISNFGKPDSKAKYVSLFGYNEETYELLNERLKTHRHCCVVQATGTGKRFIAARYMSDRIDKKILFLSPSKYINSQQKSSSIFLNNVTYMTYSGILEAAKNNVELKFDCFVFDEVHRLGNNCWGASVEQLLLSNLEAEFVGLTATPVRMCGLDIRDRFFEGFSVGNISLEDAIVRKILPSPKYVTGLINIDDDVSRAESKLVGVGDGERKSELQSLIRSVKVDWSRTASVPCILERHLEQVSGKYMVFCESVTHLNSCVEDVRKWFRVAADKKGIKTLNILDYHAHSLCKEGQNKKQIEAFNSPLDSENEVKILFSINKFNEGVHISGVDRVILLRKTSSEVLYLQQIGRSLSSGSTTTPVIFDFVDNSSILSRTSFSSRIQKAKDRENIEREKVGLSKLCCDFNLVDEITPFVERLTINAIKNTSYSQGMAELRKYKKDNEHIIVPFLYVCDNGFALGQWVNKIRVYYTRGRLDNTAISELESIGMIWNYMDHRWELGLSLLSEFKRVNGHLRVPKTERVGEFNLGGWVGSRRMEFKRGTLEKFKIDELNKLGFIWNTQDSLWEYAYLKFCSYCSTHGSANVPRSYICEDGFCLGLWVKERRRENRLGKLSVQRVNALDNIGFLWDIRESKWEKGLEMFSMYKRDTGKTKVPVSCRYKGFFLGRWFSKNVRDLESKNLSAKKLKQLKSVGFQY
ncbi:Helicase associated domain protein [Photobacterium kishitanii]|uniref:Helicase n=1 Tax=Photobacterium kishitanii TaxID=318456 RepID=A0A2T3KA04_9GAMM|nr:Helicase associated domain protein [Photobacterium kishitanii]PSU87816.1 hypothetical protein C9J27_25995 [Photobacterium kishitanii]